MSRLMGTSFRLVSQVAQHQRVVLRQYRSNNSSSGGKRSPNNRAENVRKEPGIVSEMAKNAVVTIGGPILAKVLSAGVVVLAVYGLYSYTIYSFKARAGDVLDSVGQKIKNTKDSIVTKSGEARDFVKEKTRRAVEGGKRAVDSVSSTVVSGVETTKEKVEQLKETVGNVKEKLGGVKQKSSEIFEVVRDKAEAMKDKMKGSTVTTDKENDKCRETEQKINNTGEEMKRSEVVKRKCERLKGSKDKDDGSRESRE